MRYLHCDYAALQLLPYDYIAVAVEMAKREAAEARATSRKQNRRR